MHENDPKLENLLNLALSIPKKQRMEMEDLRTGFDDRTDSWELIVRFHGPIEGLRTEHAVVEELLAGYGIVTLPEEEIPILSKNPQVEYIEKPKRLYPQIEPAFRSACFTLPEQIEQKALGEGVYVAVIDSGIEYWQSVFLQENGMSRIDWIWDQRGKSETEVGKTPAGFGAGVEYDAQNITENLREKDVAGWRPLVTDPTGHGTAVAAIAAMGAPMSRLIFVKLDTAQQKSYPMTTSVMRAFTYVIRKAKEKGWPVSINLSFGNTYGAHTGTSLLERFLDQVAEIGRNVICVGSGNEGASAGHVEGDIRQMNFVELAVADYEQSLSVQLWSSAADLFFVELIAPSGEKKRIQNASGMEADEGSFGGGTYEFVLDGTRVLTYQGGPSPYETQVELYILLEARGDMIRPGIWKLRLIPQRIVNGYYQCYLPSAVIRSAGTRFLHPSAQMTLTIPSTAQRVITVGAMDAAYQTYASFSGRGRSQLPSQETALGQKPDLVAPGVQILLPLDDEQVEVSGTSYATPFVTAAAARLMSWGITAGNDPYLYGEKVRAYLMRGAKLLPSYGTYPNLYVGWGALCVRDSLPRY